MASALHGYAIAHAQQIHRTRWDEVMIPDVENLVDWIKLFVVCPKAVWASDLFAGSRGTDQSMRAEHQQRAYFPVAELDGVLLHRDS